MLVAVAGRTASFLFVLVSCFMLSTLVVYHALQVYLKMSSLGSFLMLLKKLTISEACRMETTIRLSWIKHQVYSTLLWRYILTHKYSELDGIC